MVLLRLTVKVLPQAQLGENPGNPWTDKNTRAANFLLVVREPERVTLGELAWLITEKWRKLRPNDGPLEIKKLLDDQHDTDDLDLDLTVADVFVDNGKARADGLDQRGTVRVVQKPVERAPVRYGSVVQDWAGVTNHYARVSSNRPKPPVPLFPGTGPAIPNPYSDGFEGHDEGGVRSLRGRRTLPEIRESEVPMISTEADEAEVPATRNDGEMSPILVVDSQPEANEGHDADATGQVNLQSSLENIPNSTARNSDLAVVIRNTLDTEAQILRDVDVSPVTTAPTSKKPVTKSTALSRTRQNATRLSNPKFKPASKTAPSRKRPNADAEIWSPQPTDAEDGSQNAERARPFKRRNTGRDNGSALETSQNKRMSTGSIGSLERQRIGQYTKDLGTTESIISTDSVNSQRRQSNGRFGKSGAPPTPTTACSNDSGKSSPLAARRGMRKSMGDLDDDVFNVEQKGKQTAPEKSGLVPNGSVSAQNDPDVEMAEAPAVEQSSQGSAGPASSNESSVDAGEKMHDKGSREATQKNQAKPNDDLEVSESSTSSESESGNSQRASSQNAGDSAKKSSLESDGPSSPSLRPSKSKSSAPANSEPQATENKPDGKLQDGASTNASLSEEETDASLSPYISPRKKSKRKRSKDISPLAERKGATPRPETVAADDIDREQDKHNNDMAATSDDDIPGPKPGRLGLGITRSPTKRGTAPIRSSPSRVRSPSIRESPNNVRRDSIQTTASISSSHSGSRRGVSTTPAFPRPKSRSQSVRSSSNNEAEQSTPAAGSLFGPQTPLPSALRSAQKSSSRNSSAALSVSFADGKSRGVRSSSVFPPVVDAEYRRQAQEEGKLRTEIESAKKAKAPPIRVRRLQKALESMQSLHAAEKSGKKDIILKLRAEFEEAKKLAGGELESPATENSHSHQASVDRTKGSVPEVSRAEARRSKLTTGLAEKHLVKDPKDDTRSRLPKKPKPPPEKESKSPRIAIFDGTNSTGSSTPDKQAQNKVSVEKKVPSPVAEPPRKKTPGKDSEAKISSPEAKLPKKISPPRNAPSPANKISSTSESSSESESENQDASEESSAEAVEPEKALVTEIKAGEQASSSSSSESEMQSESDDSSEESTGEDIPAKAPEEFGNIPDDTFKSQYASTSDSEDEESSSGEDIPAKGPMPVKKTNGRGSSSSSESGSESELEPVPQKKSPDVSNEQEDVDMLAAPIPEPLSESSYSDTDTDTDSDSGSDIQAYSSKQSKNPPTLRRKLPARTTRARFNNGSTGSLPKQTASSPSGAKDSFEKETFSQPAPTSKFSSGAQSQNSEPRVSLKILKKEMQKKEIQDKNKSDNGQSGGMKSRFSSMTGFTSLFSRG